MTDEQNGTTQSWKVNNDVFRGYMKASMEGLQKRADDLKKESKEMRIELKADGEQLKKEMKEDNDSVKKEVKALHGKVGSLSKKVYIISGTIALIVSIILIFIKAFVKV